MPATQTLVAENLSCVRGEVSLFENLALSVSGGQCLHVIGANGSGKTSLLRILCGLATPDSGSVTWLDQPITGNPGFRASCAYIGHKDALKNELTAIENLRFYQRLEGAVDEDSLDDGLAKMGILKCADLPAQHLSFGQRRRLAFTRLLINRFQIWILDEPFTGIDVDGRELIEQVCVDHLQHAGIIIMTHHQSLESSALSAYRHELRLD